jgi:hypothetical protein
MLVASIAIVACATVPQASADAMLDTRQVVSLSEASTWESEPHLAVSADGKTVLAAWTAREEPGDWMGNGSIGYAFSSDGGETWRRPGTLALAGRETPYNVKVTRDGHGDFWAVWLARSFVEKDAIAVARSVAGSLSFQPAVEVTNPDLEPRWYDLPDVVAHRGVVLAAYATADDNSDCMATEVARSEDGVTWARSTVAPCAAASPVRNLNALCASETSGRIWLANATGSPPEVPLRVELRYSEDGGKTWPAGNILTVSEPGDPVGFDPITCTATGDEVWVAYGLSADRVEPGVFPKLNAVRVAHVAASGATERFDALDPAVRFAMHPHIASDDPGTIYVTYHGGARDDDPSGSIRWTSLRKGSTSFIASEQVDGPIRFDQNWGNPTFLGDYSGFRAAGGSLMSAHAFATDSGVHITFRRWPTPSAAR